MILRTRLAFKSAARPTSALPALLFTMVRSRAPFRMRASMSSEGMPAVPKPPIMTVAPSAISATAALGEATVLSIISPPSRASGRPFVRLSDNRAMNEQILYRSRWSRQRAVIEILCVYRTPDKIGISAVPDTPYAILADANAKRPATSGKARRPRKAGQAGCGHCRAETTARHAGVGDRRLDRRSEFHDLARPRASGHPRLHAAAPAPHHRATEPSHGHTARGRAALPLHAG